AWIRPSCGGRSGKSRHPGQHRQLGVTAPAGKSGENASSSAVAAAGLDRHRVAQVLPLQHGRRRRRGWSGRQHPDSSHRCPRRRHRHTIITDGSLLLAAKGRAAASSVS
ncbi:unnamed protein product, partial [Ectocarpus sp. 12 AP-2014]